VKIGIVGETGLTGLALGASTLNALLGKTEIHVLVRSEESKIAVNGIVDKIAISWGLVDLAIMPIKTFSSNLSSQNYTHLILCHPNSSSEIKNIDFDCKKIEKWHHDYKLDYNLNNLENLTLEKAHSEVAKVIGSFVNTTNMFVTSKLYHKKSVFIPIGQDDCDLAYASAQFEASISQGIVLNADFRAKKTFETSSYSQIIEYDPKNLDNINISEIPKGALLTPSRELSHPEKFLLSKCWFEFVNKLSFFHSVKIVTSPRILKCGKPADSYLVSGLAEEIFKIGA
jgi:hypothetical protein